MLCQSRDPGRLWTLDGGTVSLTKARLTTVRSMYNGHRIPHRLLVVGSLVAKQGNDTGSNEGGWITHGGQATIAFAHSRVKNQESRVPELGHRLMPPEIDNNNLGKCLGPA